MRLIKTLPEAKEKLSSGKVNLSTLSQLQTFIKKEEDFKKTKLTHDEKLERLKIIENKSQRDCEREFVRILPEIVSSQESIRPKTENSVEFKFIGSQELEAKLRTLQDLFAHQNKGRSISGLIEILADLALENKSVELSGGDLLFKVGSEIDGPRITDIEVTDPEIANPEVTNYEVQGTSCSSFNSQQNLSIAERQEPKRTSAAEVKRQVWRRDKGICQFQDPLTKKKCLSSYKIQIDHIHPKALGGDNKAENLRLLCATHNQTRAIQVFSRRHMAKFIPSLGDFETKA